MNRKYKSKALAGLLSLFMVIGILLAPLVGHASDQAGSSELGSQGNLDIYVPRKGEDAKQDSPSREFIYFKVSDQELKEDKLREIYKKADGMSITELSKEYGEGVKSNKSVIAKYDGEDHDYFKLRGLAPGTYVLKETEESAASHEYKMVAIAWASQAGISELSTVVDKLEKPEEPEVPHKYLILNKTALDENDQKIRLKGVIFKLIKLVDGEEKAIKLVKTSEGKYTYNEESDSGEKELLTNSDGQIIVSNLPDGEYRFKETNALEGYEIKNEYTDVDYKSENGKEIEVVNTKPGEEATYQLYKYDGDTNKAIAGAEFQLYAKTDDNYTPVLENEDGSYNFENGNKAIFTTNDQGYIIVRGLPDLPEKSSYVFMETKPAADYVIDDQTKTYEVKKNDVVRVKNYKKKQTIEIELTKIDRASKIPLDKVGFQLYKKVKKVNEDNSLTEERQIVNLEGEAGNYKYNQGSGQVNQLLTNTEGKIVVSNLPAGDYVFVENKPSTGYKDIKENKDKESKVFNSENLKQTITNTPPDTPPDATPPDTNKRDGGYRFVKVDDSKEQNRLAGASFALYRVDKNGKEVPVSYNNKRVTVKSGSNGEFEVKNLPFGKYVLREVAAPTGYILDEKPIPFEVTSTSINEAAITIVNKKNPDKTIVPPVVRPPSTTYRPPTVPPRPNTPRTYYVPKDRPGIPRGPIVKTGDIRIVIVLALGLVMIIAGNHLVRKDDKIQLA